MPNEVLSGLRHMIQLLVLVHGVPGVHGPAVAAHVTGEQEHEPGVV